ncbi:MAG: type I CRISPR-associated protein Cas7 [Alicyclobacillus herbarius]|uniref:CRISPR-associated protein n=1 Tax=Alicyclobacillus herbarius TaxID=122960 RepID=UPI0003F62645|nr:type I CRISPR-associated protein Cas7 [Alicyclobacillus herbarius]MCL6633560.1 type I CRISPR-associated protein Cas7 [Alicyclobacillus herbarius]
MGVRSSELLFIKSVKDGIPNRDPLNESDARRLFDEEDGRISLSDVSIKRDVRDYVLARYPDGGPEKDRFIFVREEKTEDGKLLGRGSLATRIQEASGRSGAMEVVLKQSAFDVRVFGAVFSVSKKSFQVTGPVQFGWAHSLHPVETRYVQGTVVMPSADVTKKNDSDESEGKQQGTIWTTYTLPFAVFLMPGVINAQLAEQTGMSEADTDLLLEGLWKGTQHRQARGRGLQQPLFLLHVEYSDAFFRIGYLDEYVRLLPEREAWRSPHPPTSLQEVTLDVTQLGEVLDTYQDRIARVRLWVHPSLALRGELPAETCPLW